MNAYVHALPPSRYRPLMEAKIVVQSHRAGKEHEAEESQSLLSHEEGVEVLFEAGGVQSCHAELKVGFASGFAGQVSTVSLVFASLSWISVPSGIGQVTGLLMSYSTFGFPVWV